MRRMAASWSSRLKPKLQVLANVQSVIRPLFYYQLRAVHDERIHFDSCIGWTYAHTYEIYRTSVNNETSAPRLLSFYIDGRCYDCDIQSLWAEPLAFPTLDEALLCLQELARTRTWCVQRGGYRTTMIAELEYACACESVGPHGHPGPHIDYLAIRVYVDHFHENTRVLGITFKAWPPLSSSSLSFYRRWRPEPFTSLNTHRCSSLCKLSWSDQTRLVQTAIQLSLA